MDQNQKKKKSPALEVISNPGEPPSTTERRQLPRLNLAHEQFRLSKNGKIYSLTDLSETGMAFRVMEKAEFAIFPVATELEGMLNLRREKYPVHAQVRHLGAQQVGCEFIDLTPEVKAAIQKFLDPAALGQELKPIPASETESTLWYHGPSGTDLLLWRGWDGQYRKMSLFLLGSYVQWEAEEGLTTGRFSPNALQEEVRGIVRFETLELDADESPDAGKLRIAKTLVLSSNIPQELKKWCTRQMG